jgi:hypothetical protein
MGQVRRQEHELQVHPGACHMARRARPRGPCVLDLSLKTIFSKNVDATLKGKQVGGLSPQSGSKRSRPSVVRACN